MTLNLTEECSCDFEFDCHEVAFRVMNAVLDKEKCPYEATVDLTLTDDNAIHEINLQQRGIDRATDVLSFPDIVISVDHVKVQSEEYGHSLLREFAFLVAHSMYHLIGYDHMTEAEAAVMEEKQKNILNDLHINRD